MSTNSKSAGFMDNLTNKLSGWLTPVAEKLYEFKFISALSQAFQLLMPVVIVGSFATLFAFVDLFGWQGFLASHPALQPALMAIQTVTLSMFAFYVMLVLPYLYATQLGVKEALATIPLTLATYFVLSPVDLYTAVPIEWLGHKGLISALLVSFFVVRVIKFTNDKNIKFKMPAGVPKFVVDAFSVLIPAVFLTVVAALVKYLFSLTSIGTFHNLIYVLLQTPFQRVGLSLMGNIVTETAASLAMFLGLHAMTIVGIAQPIRAAANLQNLEAWQAGLPLPNIVTGSYFTGLALIGAGGSALACTLSVLAWSKSERYKSIGKLALIPGIFGIGEPILFGLPVMLNPMFFIPWIGVTIFNQIYAYVAVATGLVGRFTGVEVSWTVPVILNPILTNSTPIRAAIAQALLIVIDLFLWYPFIKAADRAEMVDEKATSKKKEMAAA